MIPLIENKAAILHYALQNPINELNQITQIILDANISNNSSS